MENGTLNNPSGPSRNTATTGLLRSFCHIKVPLERSNVTVRPLALPDKCSHSKIFYNYSTKLSTLHNSCAHTILSGNFWSHRMRRIVEKSNIPWFRIFIFRLAIIHQHRVLRSAQIDRPRCGPADRFLAISTETEHFFTPPGFRIDQKPCVFLLARIENTVARSTWCTGHKLWNGVW